MKPNDIAKLLTEHPDVVLTEEILESFEIINELFGFGGLQKYFKDPLEQFLAQYLDKNWIKKYVATMGVSWKEALNEAMRSEVQAFKNFERSYRIPEEKKHKAYDYWKKHKRLPGVAADTDELDQRGGEWSSGGRR